MPEIESVSIDDNVFQLTKTESGEVFIFVNTPKFTLVPAEYYSKEMRNQYFDFIQIDYSNETILENKLPDWNYYILFSLKKDFISSVEKHYPNAEFYHYSTALASRLIDEDNRDTSCILIHKRDEELYLLISKNNEIVLLNLFNVRSDTDIIYFVLNSMRENKISQDSGRLYYSGDINPEDNSVLTLKKYLANIRELPPRKGDVPDNSLHNYFRFKPIK